MRTTVLLTTLLLSNYAFGQFGVDFYLKLQDANKKEVPFIDVTVIDQTSGEESQETTNAKGKASFYLMNGRSYTISFKGMKATETLSVPGRGRNIITKNYTYQLDAGYELPTNQDTLQQLVAEDTKPKPNQILLKVLMVDEQQQEQAGIEVRLTTASINKTLSAITNSKGEAHFMVKPSTHYSVSVEEMENMHEFDTPARDRIMMGVRLRYEKTIINENLVNDTIWQELAEDVKPTSARVQVRVKVMNLQRQALPDELVTMDVANKDSTVYAAVSNQDGIVNFLLPKGIEFSLNFKYDRDVDLFSFETGPYFHRTEIEFGYIGTKKIEEFYENAEHDRQGFRKDFMSVDVNTASFDPAIVERTQNGFNLNFDTTRTKQVVSPAVFDEYLLTASGYYTSKFYCLDRTSGELKWGVSLAENGASATVYYDDVLLINTQSCTLYAIDARTGKPLWNKWLGPNIFSTPSVSDSLVFTSYPNDLHGKERFVMVAFNIKTGQVVWQNWMDSEVLGSPVVYEGYVYATSQNGALYKFEGATGKLLVRKEILAIAPPTIADGKVYISIMDSESPDNVMPAIYDASDFKSIKLLPKLAGKLRTGHPKMLHASERMNYLGSRMLHYNKRNYNVLNDKLYCTNSETGALVWQVNLGNSNIENNKSLATSPIMAGGQVIISKRNGEIQFYDPEKGTLTKEYTTGSELFLPPVIHDGWIYSGSASGKTICIDTKNPQLTGWQQWGKDGSHNLVMK